MKKLLFLDDIRTPHCICDEYWEFKPEDFIIVRTYKQFVKYIKENGVPDFISFDHDLGDGKNGFDCAKWLVNYCIDNNLDFCFDYYVHSANPVGSNNIHNAFEMFKKYLERSK